MNNTASPEVLFERKIDIVKVKLNGDKIMLSVAFNFRRVLLSLEHKTTPLKFSLPTCLQTRVNMSEGVNKILNFVYMTACLS